MKQPSPIHIFRPGTHTDVSGKTLSFGEAELEASAKAYDPALHEAPLVVGHPRTDGPAYGWVRSLSFGEAGLVAQPHQVDAEFAELVRAGKFKKVSASFYTPDAPANPAPGVYYLRHVGFLGAAAPAVKGLKPVAFAEQDDDGVVEFSDAWAERQGARLWRGLREWILAKFGQEEADRAVPGYQVETLEDAAREELRGERDNSAFAENAANLKPKEGEVDQKDKEALDAERASLASERAELERQRAEFAEERGKARTAELERLHGEHVDFADRLVKEGRLLPANKATTVALLDNLAATGASLEFAEEGGGKATKPGVEAMKEMLAAGPRVVDFGELAAGEQGGGSVDFAAPQGWTVDPERLGLHSKALAYMQKNPGVDYVTAVSAVGG